MGILNFNFKRRRRNKNYEVAPDEIFLDSQNLPQFDKNQFEGRIEKPISRLSLTFVTVFFVFMLFTYLSKIWTLQIVDGEKFNQKSENNRLRHTPIFAARGVIYDRNGVELAWNAPKEGSSSDDSGEVSIRKYKDIPGLSHVLGYVQYPSKDSAGFYYQEDFKGMDGVEKYFNDLLQGANGLRLIEVDAVGKIQSQNIEQPPKEGQNLYTSIDSRVQSELYSSIKSIAEQVGFAGGGGIIMDVHTGEIIALTSYPEYSSDVMSSKIDQSLVRKYLTDKNKPLFDRVVDGLYTPGSIVKPYVAIGALNEKIIDPARQILGTAYITIQNQYDPTKETRFNDWKAHGLVDMRRALAVSSDVYFYEVGGGYKDQKGLGITRIEKYMKMFGLGEPIDNPFFAGPVGLIPTPDWKKLNFNGDDWRVGDTYNTAIGQYSFQTTPIQIVRALSAIANGGSLIDPTILKDDQGKLVRTIDIPERHFQVVREGMRMGVQEGTGVSLNVPYVKIASKSGTAELGVTKENVNSWMTGFFPYDNPRYAFAVVLEKGSRHNLIGGGAVMRRLLDWMSVNTPEYFK